jgi:hypothetical protein
MNEKEKIEKLESEISELKERLEKLCDITTGRIEAEQRARAREDQFLLERVQDDEKWLEDIQRDLESIRMKNNLIY